MPHISPSIACLYSEIRTHQLPAGPHGTPTPGRCISRLLRSSWTVAGHRGTFIAAVTRMYPPYYRLFKPTARAAPTPHFCRFFLHSHTRPSLPLRRPFPATAMGPYILNNTHTTKSLLKSDANRVSGVSDSEFKVGQPPKSQLVKRTKPVRATKSPYDTLFIPKHIQRTGLKLPNATRRDTQFDRAPSQVAHLQKTSPVALPLGRIAGSVQRVGACNDPTVHQHACSVDTLCDWGFSDKRSHALHERLHKHFVEAYVDVDWAAGMHRCKHGCTVAFSNVAALKDHLHNFHPVATSAGEKAKYRRGAISL
ncbi:hypothetical protein EXIGLDRAFT_828171 [Exidia glandulosa HHB12029]|uniref:C2H2-type domain-containing protein n=1 Tax=Exidia glandulosa HHB12029 TaxID=1314781 RepID=A0A165QYX0_EXIGL|nr:hypothetical protein EXIGLDRAFT_828171 [Exidia glandulosa HHB12029]